jgi:outer membrane protein TolC
MRSAIVFLVVFSTACTVGPNYRRPAVQIPGNFRAPEPLPPPKAESLADLKWFEVFKDDKLQALIRTALQENYDLRTAAAFTEVSNTLIARQRLRESRVEQQALVRALQDRLRLAYVRYDGADVVPDPVERAAECRSALQSTWWWLAVIPFNT